MAEINEITIAKSWIAYELQNDPVIQSKIGDDFFYGVGDKNSNDFYIVYQFVTGSLTKKLGQRRKLTRLSFDIKVYQRGRGNPDLNLVVNRIEQLFGYFINRNYQGWLFSSELDFPLDLPESDQQRKEVWQCLGGTYRVAVAEGDGLSGGYIPIGQPYAALQPFVFVQSTPSTLWIVNHNLGYKPSVEIIDSNGNEVITDVTHISNNQVQISFVIPTAGEVRCV